MKMVKGIFKGAKKIVKGAKKVFKKIASSTIGKIVIAAVIIYTGGVLFGAWGSTGPLSGIYGAWGGTAAAGAGAGAGEVAAVGAGEVAAGGVAAGETVAAGGAVTSAAPALAPEIITTAGISGAGAAPVVEAGAGLAGAGAGTQAPGFLASAADLGGAALKSAGAFAQANPALTYMGLQGLSTALSPSQADLAREQEKIRRERFASLEDVGEIDIGIRPGDSTLYDFRNTPWHERLRRAGGG